MIIKENLLPISNSYWVEPGRFLAGEYPGHTLAEESKKRISAFLEGGFDTFYDLTMPGELEPYDSLLHGRDSNRESQEVTYQRFPIEDYATPSIARMKEILDAIECAMNRSRKIYLHCWGGVGRTGVTVGCYLVRNGLTGTKAIAQLADWWQSVPKHNLYRRSPETDAQIQFIIDWKD